MQARLGTSASYACGVVTRRQRRAPWYHQLPNGCQCGLFNRAQRHKPLWDAFTPDSTRLHITTDHICARGDAPAVAGQQQLALQHGGRGLGLFRRAGGARVGLCRQGYGV